MSPIAIRGLLRRRRQIVAIVAIVALGAAVAAHHSPLSMGDMHHQTGAGAMVQLCLGVFAAVGAAVVAIALGVIELGRRRTTLLFAPPTLAFGAPVTAPRGRDGPALLCLLCVHRC